MDQLEKRTNCELLHDTKALEDKQMEEIVSNKVNISDVTKNEETICSRNKSDTEILQQALNEQPAEEQGSGVSNKSQNTAVTQSNDKKSSLINADAEIGKEVGNEVSENSEQQNEQRHNLEEKLEQLTKTLAQKENIISLYQRENALLEKEKQAFRKEKDAANKEKEAIVIKFAMKEKLLLDAKKEKEAIEKQLCDAKKEFKNISARFQAINEEKSRMTYIIDEKCNEVRKYQRECEKVKTDYCHLESKLKYHMNKHNMEVEARMLLEKKLEEERNAPNKIEEKALEHLKMEFDANTILLRHEITHKTELIENLNKERKKSTELVQELREQLNSVIEEKNSIQNEFEALQKEHDSVQSSLSDEMLNSAKLRGQLKELQLLRTQNALNEGKINHLNLKIKELEETSEYNTHDLQESYAKEIELLSINKEISESIVNLQNELCLLTAKMQGIEAENELLKKERIEFDSKYDDMEQKWKKEIEQRNEERQLLTKHLSEKTKLHEITKLKLETVLGDFEATNHKHATVVKELQREIQKYKKLTEQKPHIANGDGLIEKYHHSNQFDQHSKIPSDSDELAHLRSMSHSGSSNHSVQNSNSRRISDSSDTENTTVLSGNTIDSSKVFEFIKEPSKKHLVERILRLQQASARQTEKIDFLENHTLSLVTELQKKSKVVQYYMLRDQAGALTSSKSDHHKSELSKYGNGVMSAIYGGIKADNKSMTLELSLEINKKLQAVLEDTLLKNITLKENLDVLGIEVDNLTRQLRHLEAKV